MEVISKRNLLIYALVSAISFVYLIMHTNAGISVPVFIVIQFIFWFNLAPKKKPLWFFIPIFILALNSFLSGNSMWHFSNFLVIILLYSVMILTMIERFPIKEVSFKFLSNTLANVFSPIDHFKLPFKWWAEVDANKTEIMKRVLKGILITVPCLFLLILMLASADAIFLKGTDRFFNYLGDFVNIQSIFKIICGIVAGLYLFGLMYIAYNPKDEEAPSEVKEKSGDLTVLNILLISVLTIYTLFVFIQFRYLFAGGQLPYGLTYTEYARKGFFELLFLSGLNILLILITVNLTQAAQGLWSKITRYLCHYLCLVTIILLTSSFYRMMLYSSWAGLTRLRLLVFGFLIFEAIGLFITFFYIYKPRFNITAVYLTIGLIYYLVLNLVPIDLIVAKNQVDRVFSNQKPRIDYVLTLSPDAAPQVTRLIDSEKVGPGLNKKAQSYYDRINKRYHNRGGWRGYNLSIKNGHALLIEKGADN